MHTLKYISLYLMAGLYIAAGVNHFWHPQTYLNIMPPYLPFPELLHYLPGLAEIIFGLMLLFKKTQKLAAWGIALMLLLFFSVHIYMLQQAYRTDDYFVSRTGAWLRLALQPLLIAWALWHRK